MLTTKIKLGIMATALIAIAFTAGFLAATAILTSETTIPSGCNVITSVELGVYDSANATEQVAYIDWGKMLPTEQKDIVLYLENLVEIPLLISVSARDWMPEYTNETLTLSYAEGAIWFNEYPILQPYEPPQARSRLVLTLTASENPPSGAFTFTVVITATST